MKKASEKDQEIIELAKEIIDRTEDKAASAESIVFKAHRLAKLVEDQKMMDWLALEIYGYADKEPDITYLKTTGRTFNETTRLGNWGSISTQESMIETSLQEMEAVKSFRPSGTYASLQFSGQQQQVRNLATQIAVYRKICSRVIASVNQFASKIYYAQKFQQQITSILDKEREEAEKIIIKKIPKLKNYFEVINKNINSPKPED